MRSSLCLFLLTVSIASAAEAPPRSDGGLGAVIQPYLDKQVTAGVILAVADKTHILDLETLGYADVAAKKPMAADTMFCIASMTKAMTCAAMMMLVDEGKVKLDDPVEKYLPEFAGQMVLAEKDDAHLLAKKPTHPVLIRNLLDHTSGLPPFSPLEHPPGLRAKEEPPVDKLTLEMAVRSHAMSLLNFDPGTKWEYSNAGIATAGRVIEVVSGMPYAQFMKKRLFDPLGMTDATFIPTAAQLPRIAKTYQENATKTGLEETEFTHFTYPLDNPNRETLPAGGVICTTGDEIKFCQMLLNQGMANGHQILSPESVKAMTSVQADVMRLGTNEPARYGFGLGIQTEDRSARGGFSAGSYMHAGSDKTEMAVDPKAGLIMVFMTQQMRPYIDDGKKMVTKFDRAALAKYGTK